MACNEASRVKAYLDGEDVDASTVERHIAGCTDCTQLRDDVLALRSGIHEQATYHRADAALRGKIARAMDREEGKNGWFSWLSGAFWKGAVSGTLATACAAALVFTLLLPPQTTRLEDDVMSAHLRSLLPGHLIDIASSNHHTVKPWFAGRVDVSPPVADFAREGYSLVGGRADYLDGARAAVTIYRHGAHVINVFAWPARGNSLLPIASRNGYHIIFWSSGNVDYCAVSDTALDELLGLVRLLKAMGTPDSRE